MGSHGAGGGSDAAGFVGGEVVGERQSVEVDEGVARGVLEGVRRRAPARVPDAALVEPRRRGGPIGGGRGRGSTERVADEEAEEEQERVEGGGDERRGQGGEQAERLHGCCSDLLKVDFFLR